MLSTRFLKLSAFLIMATAFLNSCNGKLPGGDARKYPADPKKRIEQNIKDGKSFRLFDSIGNSSSGAFDFASSNELWRASLDVIDFMPLSSVNYSGGIIITDWYSDTNNQNESIKISIRFLSNEIRSDALNIKIFTRKCKNNLMNCNIIETNKILITELKKEILKRAAQYESQKKSKKK